MKAMTPEERRLYFVWKSMKDRCRLPTNKAWKAYGGRGIKVCEAWQDDFSRFVKDVGLPPSPGLDLDRHPDKNGDYRPGNVRWVSHQQNMMNVRTNRPVTIAGVRKMASEWADEYGISRSTFCCRMKWGWEGEELLKRPRPKVLFVIINGVKKKAVDWAKETGICHTGFLHRIEQGEVGDKLLRPSQKQKKD